MDQANGKMYGKTSGGIKAGRGKRTEQANGEMFGEVFRGKAWKEIRDLCGYDISIKTLRRVKDSRMVFYSTLERLAGRTRTSIKDWILHDKRIALPKNEAFFEGLKWSYYLGHDEESDGNLSWREEQITMLPARRGLGGSVPKTMRFRGKIRSWQGGREKIFTYIASRANEFYLGIVAHSTTHDGVAFHAVMSHVVEDVLCGLWLGLCPKGNRMAVYRMFLSSRRLSGADLDGLSNSAPIKNLVYLAKGGGQSCIKFDDENKVLR